jgi:hypothetical protein
VDYSREGIAKERGKEACAVNVDMVTIVETTVRKRVSGIIQVEDCLVVDERSNNGIG